MNFMASLLYNQAGYELSSSWNWSLFQQLYSRFWHHCGICSFYVVFDRSVHITVLQVIVVELSEKPISLVSSSCDVPNHLFIPTFSVLDSGTLTDHSWRIHPMLTCLPGLYSHCFLRKRLQYQFIHIIVGITCTSSATFSLHYFALGWWCFYSKHIFIQTEQPF